MNDVPLAVMRENKKRVQTEMLDDVPIDLKRSRNLEEPAPIRQAIGEAVAEMITEGTSDNRVDGSVPPVGLEAEQALYACLDEEWDPEPKLTSYLTAPTGAKEVKMKDLTPWEATRFNKAKEVEWQSMLENEAVLVLGPRSAQQIRLWEKIVFWEADSY